MDAHEEPSEWRCDFCGAGPFTYDVGPGGWDAHWRTCEKSPRSLESRAMVGHPQTFPADPMSQLVEVTPSEDDGLGEDAVQAVALALAELSLRRPGWLDYLRGIAEHYDAHLLFAQFRQSSAGVVPEAKDSPLVSEVERMRRVISNVQNYLTNAGRDHDLLWSHLRTMLAQDGVAVPDQEDDRTPTYEDLLAEVRRLKNKCARYAEYSGHQPGCKAFVIDRGNCDCGYLEILADVNVGLVLPPP